MVNKVGLGVFLTIKCRSGKEGVPRRKFKKDNFRLKPTLYECECVERHYAQCNTALSPYGRRKKEGKSTFSLAASSLR